MLLKDHPAELGREPESAPAQPVLPDRTIPGQVRLGRALLRNVPGSGAANPVPLCPTELSPCGTAA